MTTWLVSDEASVDIEALANCERVIEAGLSSFIEVGSALSEIRDRKLYREQFSTFEEYCEQRWHISRSRGYRLMDAAEIAGTLSPMGDIPEGLTERQVRPLKALPKEERAAAWAKAVESAPNGAVTAKDVEKAVMEAKEGTATGVDKSRAAVEERRERILELNEQGYRIADIAAEIGTTESLVGEWLSKSGVESINARIGKVKRINTDDAMASLVEGLTIPEEIMLILDTNWDKLDRDSFAEWEHALTQTIKQATALRDRLRKEQQ